MDVIELTKHLIRAASITHTPQKEALDALESALSPLGFVCKRFTFSEPETAEVENMYAVLNKGNTPHLCFGGHVDVVPPGDEAKWDVPPFAPEIKGEYLIGRGTEDMKGAIACFVKAVEHFLADNTAFGGCISLLIAGDEEGSGRNGTKKVLAALKESGEPMPEVYLVGEPTNPTYIGEMAKIGRRGSMNCDLKVQGKQGHVAYQQLADNPVSRMVRILHEIKTHHLDDGTAFFLPSNLEITTVDVNNPAVNVIPQEASAQFNIRFNTDYDSAKLQAWLHEVCGRHAENYTLSFHVSGEPFLTEPGAWSAVVEKAVQDATGNKPALTTTGGTSDARFFKDYGPVVEFGTTGKTAHMINEKVKVEDLKLLERCYLSILKHYFQ